MTEDAPAKDRGARLLWALVRAALLVAVVLPVLAMPSEASAQARYYIANDDHTDYFWSGTDEDYRIAFQSMLDFYMEQAERTADLPADHRGRFNVDGTLWLYEYSRARSEEDMERLIGHVRAGNISVPFQSLVLLPGAMPTEAVLRDMYYAGRLERRYGLDLELAVMMENHVLPLGIASLWEGAGVKYSWKGVCGCASEVPEGPRSREIYRMVGKDGRGVVMKWNSLRGNNESLGGYAEARDPAGAVAYMSTDETFRQAWPSDEVFGAFGYGWDDLSSTTDAFVDAAQSLSDEDRRVIVSNEVDFFEDYVETHGDELEEFSASHGNEWDLYTASLAGVTADMRRQVERLRTAEAMSTVVGLHRPGVLTDRTEERERAFLFMGLYYEHDWTADSGIGHLREGFQRRTHAVVRDYVNDVYNEARQQLGRLVEGAPGIFVVFNPLTWSRTDVVLLTAAPEGLFHVVDLSTGDELPAQRVDGGIAVVVPEVPSLGYRRVEIRAGEGTDGFAPVATYAGGRLVSDNYELVLDGDGAIRDLVHVPTGRQLVRPGGALGAKGPPHSASVELVENGPVRATLRVDVATAPAHTAWVRLTRGIDRVELDMQITENFSGGVFYDFQFAGRTPVVHHEEVGALLRVGRKANGGDYADELTRTDYLTLGHFADVSSGAAGVTLSSWDSSFFAVGDSDTDTLDADSGDLRVVVGMQVDGEHLGIRGQGGDAEFHNRYAVTAHQGYGGEAALRFALEHQNPFVGVEASGSGNGRTEDVWSLLEVEGALGWAVKPADDGIERGVVVRYWNAADQPSTVRVRVHAGELEAGRQVTHVETDRQPLELDGQFVSLEAAGQQLQTVRIGIGGLGVVVEPDPDPEPEPEPEPAPEPAPDVGVDATHDADDPRGDGPRQDVDDHRGDSDGPEPVDAAGDAGLEPPDVVSDEHEAGGCGCTTPLRRPISVFWRR
jgi:alpha-mannosidase